MSRIKNYFGLEGARPAVVKLATKFTTLSLLMQASVAISTTFYLIFVAEALGNGSFIIGMTYVGILVVVQMAVQTLFDYPTGVIGDWIGQHYILTTAFATYAVAFFLVSLVTSSSPFWMFILIYSLMGFAGSQQSGALGSWFDNNWRVAMTEDEGRKQYGVFIGKMGMLAWFINVLILIPGGILATIFSRSWVFQVQAILCIVIAIACGLLVRNLPETDDMKQTRPTLGEYFTLLRDGIQYLFSGRFITYLLIGSMLMNSCLTVWANLILFPMYYSYLLTDVAVASFRTLVMLPLVFYSERSGVWAKKFEPGKWIPRFRFVQTGGAVFFWIFAFLMIAFPVPPPGAPMVDLYIPSTDILILSVPVMSIAPVLLMIVVFYGLGIFFQLANVLTSRIFIDAIPNRVRNGVYSLFPTIILILGIPQIAFFGWLISVAPISLTLVLTGGISTMGVFMIFKAFQQPRPSEEETIEEQLT
ncbi:MAG: MFS transporter [Candidatus Thorarchaeota archaeon]